MRNASRIKAGGDLTVLLKEGLEIKLDKLVGRDG
jgi:hypothetical protein